MNNETLETCDETGSMWQSGEPTPLGFGPGAPPNPITAKPASIDRTHDVPCTITMDRPGPHFAGVPSGADNLSVDASITYDISTTLECHDEDGGGTKSDSVTVKGTYEGKGIKW